MLSLAEENDLLREQVRQLRAVVEVPKKVEFFGGEIRGMRAVLLSLLMRHDHITRPLVMQALYGRSLEPPDEKIVDVMLCKLRRELRPHGVEVRNMWGVGWFISEEDKRKVRA